MIYRSIIVALILLFSVLQGFWQNIDSLKVERISSKYLKYFLIFLIGIGFIRISSSAQNNQSLKNDAIIDSLKILLSNKEGLSRFELLYDLTFEHIAKNDLEGSLAYVNEALKVSLNFGDSLKIVKSTRVKGQILRRLDRTNEAIVEFQRILPIAKRNDYTSEVKFILNSLAVAYTFRADFDEALNYHFQSLVIRQNEGNKAEISAAFNNIGLVYFKLKSYDKALEYYGEALKLENSVNNSNFKDRLLINIGLCYNELKDFASSRKYINEGITLCAPNCHDPTIIEGEFGLGVSYYEEKLFEEAKRHFQKSFSISYNTGDKRFQAENLVYISLIFLKRKKIDSAIAALLQVEKIAVSSGYNQILIKAYQQLSSVYYERKDFKMASDYQGRYIELNDKVHNEEMTNNLMKIEAEYQQRENLAHINSQNQILALKEEGIQRQQLLKVIIGAMALMLVLLAAILIRSNRQKQMINQILDEKVKEKTMALEESYNALMRASKERDILIARTSNDINSSLATIKGLCTVGLQDISDPDGLQYISQMNITSDHLAFTLKNLQALGSVQQL